MPGLTEFPEKFVAIRAKTRDGKVVFVHPTFTQNAHPYLTTDYIVKPEVLPELIKKIFKGQYKYNGSYLNYDSLEVVEVKWSITPIPSEELNIVDVIRANALQKLNNIEAEILGINRLKVYEKLREPNEH